MPWRECHVTDAWRANVSPAVILWTLPDRVLFSSAFAIAEAERNLDLLAARPDCTDSPGP